MSRCSLHTLSWLSQVQSHNIFYCLLGSRLKVLIAYITGHEHNNNSRGLIITVTTGVGVLMIITVTLCMLYIRRRRRRGRRNQAYMYLPYYFTSSMVHNVASGIYSYVDTSVINFGWCPLQPHNYVTCFAKTCHLATYTMAKNSFHPSRQ